MQTDPQLGLRVVDLDLDWTGVECNRPQWTALEWRARRVLSEAEVTLSVREGRCLRC